MLTIKLNKDQFEQVMELIDLDLEGREDDLRDAERDQDVKPEEIMDIKRGIADTRGLLNVFVMAVAEHECTDEDFATDSEL